MDAVLGWRKRLFFSAIAALFVVLSMEGMLQLYYYASAGDFLFRRTFYPIFEPDEHRCYRLKPGPSSPGCDSPGWW